MIETKLNSTGFYYFLGNLDPVVHLVPVGGQCDLNRTTMKKALILQHWPARFVAKWSTWLNSSTVLTIPTPSTPTTLSSFLYSPDLPKNSSPPPLVWPLSRHFFHSHLTANVDHPGPTPWCGCTPVQSPLISPPYWPIWFPSFLPMRLLQPA